MITEIRILIITNELARLPKNFSQDPPLLDLTLAFDCVEWPFTASTCIATKTSNLRFVVCESRRFFSVITICTTAFLSRNPRPWYRTALQRWRQAELLISMIYSLCLLTAASNDSDIIGPVRSVCCRLWRRQFVSRNGCSAHTALAQCTM